MTATKGNISPGDKEKWSKRLGAMLRRGVAFVWPVRCPLCDRQLKRGEEPICLSCLASLPSLRTDSVMAYVGAPGNTVNVRSWFVYNTSDGSHRLIHDIKYHGRSKLARKLGREFALQKDLSALGIELVVPIPLHWTKRLKRGYNQAYEIALGIRDVTGIPLSESLYARKAHATQTRRDRMHREENVRDIFGIRNAGEFDGKHIALLDDVITTGATMTSALRTILEVAQPASVTFLSLASTKKY